MYVYRADSSGHQHSGLIVPTGEAKIMGELTNFIDLSDVVDVQAVNHTANMFQVRKQVLLLGHLALWCPPIFSWPHVRCPFFCQEHPATPRFLSVH